MFNNSNTFIDNLFVFAITYNIARAVNEYRLDIPSLSYLRTSNNINLSVTFIHGLHFNSINYFNTLFVIAFCYSCASWRVFLETRFFLTEIPMENYTRF